MTAEQKALIEQYNNLKINLDDTFQFHCTECGKCCKHREDIMLTPRDIYNISKELKITIKELIAKYCEVYLGQDSHVPIVRILPRGNVQRCSFLKSNKCLVHKAKPTICAMFPIGRILVYPEQSSAKPCKSSANQNESSANSCKSSTNPRIEYIFINPSCGDKTETYKVRDWLEMFNIPYNDEFFTLWTDTVQELYYAYKNMSETNKSNEAIMMFEETAFRLLYTKYDLEDTDFLNQFKQNKKEIENIINQQTNKSN